MVFGGRGAGSVLRLPVLRACHLTESRVGLEWKRQAVTGLVKLCKQSGVQITTISVLFWKMDGRGS